MAPEAGATMYRELNDAAKDGFILEDTEGTFVSPINATFENMLWAAAGSASPEGSFLIIVLVGSWVVWPVNYLQIRKIFTIFGVRSDTIFSYIFGLVLPMWILLSGVLVGRDAFEWIKTISLMVAAVIFTAIKYHLPPPNLIWHGMRMSYIYSRLGHGILFVNVAEAVLWELTQLQGEAYNYINGIAGGIQMLLIIAYAKRYGFGVLERDEEKECQLRGNLTPLYIIGYTFWNIEYNAVYHPAKAMFYIYVTLIIPLLASWLGHIDWLEIRAQSLLHAICLRTLPVNFSGPMYAPLTLFQEGFESEQFRYTFTILSAITTVAMVWEAVTRVSRAQKHFNFWGYALNIDVDERHPEKYYVDGDDFDDFSKTKVMATDV